MPSSLVTSLLWIDTDEHLLAKVLSAEPSATTYLLNCTPEPDGRDCGLYVTVTLGPWASETPPPSAARTGDFDLYITDPVNPWRFSLHCGMSGTVPQKCTTINIGGNDEGRPTATLESEEDLEEQGFAEFGYATVTITEGLELLATTHSSSREATAASTEGTSASAQSTAGSAASATAASKETSGTESSSGTSTPEATSVASSCKARVITAMSVAGVAMAVVFS
ncbi:hypothetical protein CEP51_001140 [Fusarium floridanum]|uniref:Uncharacterized protein n=1 Tax=Fusarium floridanum TaxID=1325733 RepID=A0A428SIJ0_9HYPO|nr:hypothetical protein CEP51_001140 [Fusarium floridanum]